MRLAIFICLTVMQLVWSHGGEDHSSPSIPPQPVNERVQGIDEGEIHPEKPIGEKIEVSEAIHSEHNHHEKAPTINESKIVDAKMSDFPSLHPLVVHFPIVLLVLLPLLLSLWIWRSKKELLYLSLLIAAGGSLGALVASTVLHPHTSGLSEVMRQVLAKHDYWAYSTTGSAFITLAILVLLIKFEKVKALKVLVLIASIYTAIAVSFAGHYGATLTHIHGVGSQGQYLEANHDH